jgi:hypothetical protein
VLKAQAEGDGAAYEARSSRFSEAPSWRDLHFPFTWGITRLGLGWDFVMRALRGKRFKNVEHSGGTKRQ